MRNPRWLSFDFQRQVDDTGSQIISGDRKGRRDESYFLSGIERVGLMAYQPVPIAFENIKTRCGDHDSKDRPTETCLKPFSYYHERTLPDLMESSNHSASRVIASSAETLPPGHCTSTDP